MKKPDLPRGYALAWASIILVTLAQLLLKSGVILLPKVDGGLSNLSSDLALELPELLPGLLLVAGGLLGYLGSLLCWLGALAHLPLHRAYPLLALSYGLVYLAALALPWFEESISLGKSIGVLLIMLGVWLSQSTGAKQN